MMLTNLSCDFLLQSIIDYKSGHGLECLLLSANIEDIAEIKTANLTVGLF